MHYSCPMRVRLSRRMVKKIEFSKKLPMFGNILLFSAENINSPSKRRHIYMGRKGSIGLQNRRPVSVGQDVYWSRVVDHASGLMLCRRWGFRWSASVFRPFDWSASIGSGASRSFNWSAGVFRPFGLVGGGSNEATAGVFPSTGFAIEVAWSAVEVMRLRPEYFHPLALPSRGLGRRWK
jgi:hypothetical protein